MNIRNNISENREPVRGDQRVYGAGGAFAISGHRLVAEIWNWAKHNKIATGHRNEQNFSQVLVLE